MIRGTIPFVWTLIEAEDLLKGWQDLHIIVEDHSHERGPMAESEEQGGEAVGLRRDDSEVALLSHSEIPCEAKNDEEEEETACRICYDTEGPTCSTPISRIFPLSPADITASQLEKREMF